MDDLHLVERAAGRLEPVVAHEDDVLLEDLTAVEGPDRGGHGYGGLRLLQCGSNSMPAPAR
jgi:hypothetical protein